MGKPFANELRDLNVTYQWALNADIDQLKEAISEISNLPLLCIGSGGSFSAAHFVSKLHETFFRPVSKPLTPLEFVDTAHSRGKAVLFLSAGGRNPDILGAFRDAIHQEAARVIVVCFQKGSRLSDLAKKYRHVDLIEYEIPTGRDGFLATNSLLAFILLVLRAYVQNAGAQVILPESLNELLRMKSDGSGQIGRLEAKCRPLWKKNTLIVLHGTDATSAAIDVESKFTEAALHTTQTADYRNFAHGRHHWLAKHGDTSAVLALITPDDYSLAKKTLDLLPTKVPVIAIDTVFSGVVANLALVVIGFYLTSFVGKVKGIDPGRPGVPPFGSKIYRLNAFGKLRPRTKKSDSTQEAAICRKTQSTIDRLRLDGSLSYWRKAYAQFARNLQSERFQAIILDYDGTLCDEHDRFTGISDEIGGHLRRLLEAGITIGIATGRGKSVRGVLQAKLPRSTWSSILIGYYNCSEISNAADNLAPDGSNTVCDDLKSIADSIRRDPILKNLSKFTFRQNQITVEPNSKISLDFVWDLLQQKVNAVERQDCRLVRSSHSFDIIARGVSKSNLVRMIENQQPNSSILCIGDKGRFPGNDYELLSQPNSLSVDEVSPSSDSCWNIADAGVRGVQATGNYFRSLVFTKTGLKFKIP